IRQRACFLGNDFVLSCACHICPSSFPKIFPKIENPLAGFGASERALLRLLLLRGYLRNAPACQLVAATTGAATRTTTTTDALDHGEYASEPDSSGQVIPGGGKAGERSLARVTRSG